MNNNAVTHISGLSEIQTTPVLAELIEARGSAALIITPNIEWAASIAKNLEFFTDRSVFVHPEADPFLKNSEARSHEDLNARLESLAALVGGGGIVVAPTSGALLALPNKEVFAEAIFELAVGSEISQEELKKRFTEIGYERVTLVEEKGCFSLRGDILDIFPPNSEQPVRAEFFGDEVESIRFFDANTQKSKGRIETFGIYPAAEYLLGNVGEDGAYHFSQDFFADNLADYLPEDGVIAVVDPERIEGLLSLEEKERAERLLPGEGEAGETGEAVGLEEIASEMAGVQEFETLLNKRELWAFTPAHDAIKNLKKVSLQRKYESRQPAGFAGHLDLLKRELKKYIKAGFEVTIVCSTNDRKENLKELLLREGILAYVKLVKGYLTGGMELTSEKKVWLWDGDIFGSTKRKRQTKDADKNKAPIKSFSDIVPGDFVVHENHGIGKYAGIEQLTVEGKKRDYLKIQYAGKDLLYVPVDQMSVVQKYIGGGEAGPKVHKLSGMEWKNAKARARADIAEMAGEIVALSAERLSSKGHAFSQDTVWQFEFEEKFPYEETDDQLKSIRSIKKDMEKPVPMDRLLCGDVGYGKTEVALRAIFKCAMDGKQAAVLVPTTILAEQHFGTFQRRLADFPVNAEVLSRFRTDAEQKEIVRKLGTGELDIVIGTHRLLSEDVRFKDLGLLVIDEEQRFGVKHKEKIKAIRKNVDVLTLTATPIPRTLHMSLMGIRDMDLIEEPPEDRYPVQTYVMEESDEILRETIRRELARKGQVYVVVRRISGIERIAASIRALVPEASVAVGHGRMNETELEARMVDFIDGRYDVLVATTIIESGLDIPNVNTMIVLEADHFGLSQLYQLRGRVGRSNRVAFAYLLHHRDKQLSEVAEKRLRTIREFTEFGAGFKIAMRDLEIRGAGNLLGAQQSGNIATVGYELYVKMVEEAVLGKSAPDADETDVKLDLPVNAFVPDNYISDEELKLEAYKRLSLVDSQDSLEDAAGELEDRFGPVPSAVASLAQVAYIRHMAGGIGLKRIYLEGKTAVFVYENPESFDPQKILTASETFEGRLKIKGTTAPMLRFSLPEEVATGKDADRALLNDILSLLEALM